MAKKNKIQVKVPLWIHLLRPFIKFYYRRILHYKQKEKIIIPDNEPSIVLSNHVTDFDGIFLHCECNKFLYTISTDNVFNNKNYKFLKSLGMIAKRKGLTDIASTKEMMKVVMGGGSLLLFPEGNRSYAEFQFFISEGLIGFIKKFKLTIILHNIHGGFGVNPRFGNTRRKGPFYGEIKRVLKYDEYKDMSLEELTKIVRDNLKVYDSDSNIEYLSDQKAEYLERMFFVCPKCGKISSLRSEGNYIHCDSCGLSVEYTTKLKLRSDDKDFKFNRLVDWYDYQRKFLRELEIKDNEIIFEDDNVLLMKANPFQEKTEIGTGKLTLTNKKMKVGDVTFNVHDIEIASPMSGRNLIFTYQNNSYQIHGEERFNALKYVLIFNKLDTIMKELKTDDYYPIEGELYK